MEKGLVQESVQKFEFKKEFREVKLTTKKSFKEDQEALEKRLSKYRNMPDRTKSESEDDAEVNGHEKPADVGVANAGYCGESINGETGLDNIDVCIDGDNNSVQKKRTNSTVSSGSEEKENKTSRTESTPDNVNKLPNGHTVKPESNVNTKQTYNSTSTSAQTTVQTIQQTNGIPNGSVQNNGHIRNGSLPNGQSLGHTAGQYYGHGGHSDGRTTPDPKIKLLKGIYQKNPRLNAGSTDHLDNISLKSFRSGPRAHEIRQHAGPIVPSAEVTSIPADGNLLQFNVAQMVTVFRLLNVPGELIYKLFKCEVDGRKFATISDQELDDLGMNNPIIRYFRDRTALRPKKRKKLFFVL